MTKNLLLFIKDKIFYQNINMYKLFFKITKYSSRIMNYLCIKYISPAALTYYKTQTYIKLIFEASTIFFLRF